MTPVRWAKEETTNNIVLIIGDSSSVWHYPKLQVEYLHGHSSSYTGFDGWTMGLETDLSTYNVAVNAPTRAYAFDRSEQSLYVVNNRVYADNYHPLADTATNQSGGTVDATAITCSGVVTALDFNSTSDIRKKELIEQVSGLEIITRLRGVQYNWKETGTRASGVIAQEIEEVIPHAVGESDGYKNVSYQSIIPYLIESIKEQQEQIK